MRKRMFPLMVSVSPEDGLRIDALRSEWVKSGKILGDMVAGFLLSECDNLGISKTADPKVLADQLIAEGDVAGAGMILAEQRKAELEAQDARKKAISDAVEAKKAKKAAASKKKAT